MELTDKIIKATDEDRIGTGGRLLLEGSHIYLKDPEGSRYALKQYPDGRRELVDFTPEGKEIVVKTLAPQGSALGRRHWPRGRGPVGSVALIRGCHR